MLDTVGKYPYAVYSPEGGGLAVYKDGNKRIFIEAPPEVMGLHVGDEVPSEWSMFPANRLAQAEMRRDQHDEGTILDPAELELELTLLGYDPAN